MLLITEKEWPSGILGELIEREKQLIEREKQLSPVGAILLLSVRPQD